MAEISFLVHSPTGGLDEFFRRVVTAAQQKAADDPACREAKEGGKAFFAANPRRTFHLRLACEAEFGLFLEWPFPGEARFILTQLFQADFQMEWPICLPAEMATDVLSEADLLDIWRSVVPDAQKAQARRMAADYKAKMAAGKRRRPRGR